MDDKLFPDLDSLPIGTLIKVRHQYWGTTAFTVDPDDEAIFRIIAHRRSTVYPRKAVHVEQVSGPPCDVAGRSGLSPIHAVSREDSVELPYWVAFLVIEEPI